MVVPFLDHAGGMERAALWLAERFHAAGIPTLLLTCRHLRDDPTRTRPVPPAAFPVLRPGVLQRAPLLDLTWVLPGALRLFARRASLKAILAHHLPSSGALAGLAARWSGLPFGVVTHGVSDAAMLRRLPCPQLRVATVNRARFITSLNPQVDRELVQAGIAPDLVRRVPNPCDVTSYRPPTPVERKQAREALGLREEERVLAFTGRLAVEKRLPLLLEAFAGLPGRRVRLLLAGDGPERERLQQLAERSGIAGRIAFLGRLDDVRPVLWAADLFCQPSSTEGMSMALLEAMACGLPAAASDVAGNREVLTDGSDGFLVAGADPSDWTALLSRLAVEEETLRRAGLAARGTVQRRFRAEIVEGFYLDWFRSL
jgi:glycosyltransferase involved in cell wall biosynthesis